MKWITFFIALIPMLAFSQPTPSIDFISGFDYSYRKIKVLEQCFFSEIRKEEVGKFNRRIGLNYSQPLTDNLFLKTGLSLASIGYKGKNNTNVQWPSENNGGTWVEDPALPREIQLIYDYRFLEIPIALRWEFTNKKITPFIELGTAPSLYLTSKTTTKTDIGRDVHRGRNPQLNGLHIVGIGAVGINYAVNESLQFFGQPTFRYYLTNLGNHYVKENLFNYGIELGLRKKLGKKSVEK